MGEQNNLTTLAKRLRPLMKLAMQEVLRASVNISQTPITISGNLSIFDLPLIYYNELGVLQTITRVSLTVGTAPTGAAIIVDIHRNGTTIFTNQAHRPQIADGAYTGYTTDIDVNDWKDGDYLTVCIDQIGSGAPGSNLAVNIVCQAKSMT